MSNLLMPKKVGYYGRFGGVFVPELLVPALEELTHAWNKMKCDPVFQAELAKILQEYAGRATPLTEVKRFAQSIKGPRVFLKREDLLHTGAHKLNNALGQCLLAKQLGKTRIIAETGAGQHGVATATACAFLGLECVVYMGQVDMQRQAINVAKMQMLGATVRSVLQGTQTLKDAVNEALRDWSESFTTTHYCLGSALGPYPFPEMVETFQSVIGKEAKQQFQTQCNHLPTAIIACVGGGSNAIGIFSAFIKDESVKLIGVEAGGKSFNPKEHAARFATGKPGVLHGNHTYVLQDENGQVLETHSISAGLDYPAVAPQHAHLFETSRAHYTSVTDKEAVAALQLLAKTEGIIAALESSHALAYLIANANQFAPNDCVIVSLSGRGDKDLAQLSDYLGETHE